MGVVIVDSDAFHASIEEKVDAGGFVEGLGSGFYLVELVYGGGGNGDVVIDKEGELVIDNAAHDEDGGGDAVFAEEEGFF